MYQKMCIKTMSNFSHITVKRADWLSVVFRVDLSNHFIVNLQLTWAEVIVSSPHITVTIGTCIGIAAAIKVRVIVVSCVVCNVDIMAPAKGWTIARVAVCGILVVWVYVLFKVSITVTVSKRVYKRVGGVLVSNRRWRDTNVTRHSESAAINQQIFTWIN